LTRLCSGRPGEVYNVGGGSEKRNIDVVKKVLSLMKMGQEYMEFVPDRPGHDYRYAIDYSKLRNELGWTPGVDFDTGIERTIMWYMENQWWWRPLKERLSGESKGFWSGQG